jgi:hypothetical protein
MRNWFAIGLIFVCLPTTAAEPRGDATIRARAGKSEIVITTTSRLAGAIGSLTWNGKEFIDSTDHGRELQSASNFDCGTKFIPEVFNPTEAGSRDDSAGPTSTSRLLKLHAEDALLETITQMAFWLRPGEKSLGNLARNEKPLSDHLLIKRVQIGYKNLPHAIQYDATFTVPAGESHRYAQFEAVTGYMPAEFGKFYAYDEKNNAMLPLSDGPGEQTRPVVLATASGSHAMGVFSPDQPSRGFENAGYGRFRFERERVTKWNSVFRIRDSAGIQPGDYHFRNFVVVGTLDDVKTTLAALMAEYPRD